MPTWYLFVALRLAVVVIVARGRLDPVRVLGVFVFFEALYLFLWKFLVWFSHPDTSEGLVENLAMVGLLILSAGIPAVILLWGVSRIGYFRGKAAPKMTVRRCLLITPFLFILAILQGL